MTPERWQQIRALYEHASSLCAAERETFLDKTCSVDGDLRQEVESLLGYEVRAGNQFLQTPAADLLQPLTRDEPIPSRIGRRVGAYEILDEIGTGGMGEVYRAVRADGQYEKQVAVKLVRVGLDSRFVLDRFLNERQILATLDHPNIARLLDGGTTEDGVPYLVMELIAGQRIDVYCEAYRLSISQRLNLFRQVCGAVQYAHQRLVIHRDIKPGNILVTEEGIPKLLDFGIAKILDPLSGDETTLARPMTPEFASPEQIRGEAITTASDTYSLGVVLYQLLTGRSPYRVGTESPHELSRAIAETEPQRPSTIVVKIGNAAEHGGHASHGDGHIRSAQEGSPAKLRRRLLGDLDNIVLKALRKEAPRRYSSVEQFAEDIRRHLEGLPVVATHDTWTYRLGKFFQRHRTGVLVAELVFLALIVGVGLIVREARIARAEGQRADKRFNDVRKLANSLIFEIHDSISDLPGSTSARKLLVTRALEYLDSLAQQAKGDASLQEELATAYDRVGDVLGYPYGPNLGDSSGALQSYRKALEIRESLAPARAGDVRLQGDLVRNYLRIANVLESTGNFNGALEAIRKALPLTQKMASGTKDPTLADHLAGAYYFTAELQRRTGDSIGAFDTYRRAASIREAALQTDPTNFPLNTHLAADYAGMAFSMKAKGDMAQAIETQNKAVQILDRIARSTPNNTAVREYLAEATNRLGTFRKEDGDPAAALEAYQHAHQIFLELLRADAKNVLAKTNFGFSGNGIAESMIALGKPTSALGTFREAVATFETMDPRASANRYVRTGLAEAYSGIGNAYSALATQPRVTAPQERQHWLEAKAWYEKSSSLWADKEKRGELESDERDDEQAVVKALAKCRSALDSATTAARR
jgi:eukaryotic-like serine/threonine-protein kinase